MKGKVFKFKVVLTSLLIVAAGFCFMIGQTPQNQSNVNTYAALSVATLADEEYSALLDGDVIFSVEKVAVSSDEENGVPKELTGSGVEKFLTNDDKNASTNDYLTFYDIPSETTGKTVVQDGKFVMLENNYYGNRFYSSTDVQEAVIVSMGAYVYFPETDDQPEMVMTAINDNLATTNVDETICAKISYLEVVVTRNGVQEVIPSIRNISVKDTGLFFDFAYLITQQEDNSNEGFYEITLRYTVTGVERTASFSFYMVNKSSYVQTTNELYGYTASPTLGWSEGGEFSKNNPTYTVDKYVRYKIGENGTSSDEISFPTLTYDYTRYKLNFIQTANQKTIKYDLSVEYSTRGSTESAKLLLSRTEQGITTAREFEMYDYVSDAATNLVTIMITDPGSYDVSYEFLYKGYNSKNAPKMDFDVKEIKFSIHGMDLKYSKTGYDGAEMQYFEISKQSVNNVDLVVLSGYNIETNDDDDSVGNGDISRMVGQKLGFVYKFVESTKREGNVQLTNTISSISNYTLDNISTLTTKAIMDDFEEYNANKANLDDVLKQIYYAETNQGSLWLEGNDQFDKENSFYFYSPTKFTANSLVTIDDNNVGVVTSTKRDFTNTTSFNQKGYYLVFVKIIPSGIVENASSHSFYQVFAFQYTSSSTNISIKSIDDNNTPETADDVYEVIASGKYTNKNVQISWKKPGIFDRSINAKYYSSLNQNLTKEDLLLTTAHKFNITEIQEADGTYYVATLGSEVNNGEFVKYLLRIENEGDSVTHKIFTIDRQDISGIKAYLVQQINSGNSIFYSFATDVNNNLIGIDNSVTDGIATIIWNDKASGSEITAKYSYTPFILNNSEIQKIINSGNEWITTNYGLGETISGIDFNKPTNRYSIGSDGILINQGIYILELNDSAGNKAIYALVIDKTSGYFQVNNNEYLTSAFRIYGDDVQYNVGDYKAFKLFSESDTLDANLKNLIQNASLKTMSKFEDYYAGDNNHLNALSKIFQKQNSDYYLTIRNKKVIAYENSGGAKEFGLSGKLTYEVASEAYYTCSLYVSGENHEYSLTKTSEKSNIRIEINKDNARGYVYYYTEDSDKDSIPTNGAEQSENGTVFKLKPGSDNDENNGLLAAEATSANHLAFIWNKGDSVFEIEKITYDFYSLNLYNYDTNGKLYFYGSPQSFIVYNKGEKGANYHELSATNQAYVCFDGSSTTKAGLYVVSRTYVGEQESLGDDVKTKNYYFIVDRNGIIDTSARIGTNIEICLMEDELEFNTFSGKGYNTGTFSYSDDHINREVYNIYLSTTKLPATLSIPTGKYYDGTNSSADYKAGRLKVSVYFRDTENQLPLDTGVQGGTIKIYDSDYYFLEKNQNIYNSATNTFEIDIYKYLTEVNTVIRDRIAISNQHGDWLFLPGEYVIRITDNVESRRENDLEYFHSKFIGLSIVGKGNEGPEVETLTGFEKGAMVEFETSFDGEMEVYYATVSQEYLEIRLPEYSWTNAETAQVDPNYLIVEKTNNNITTPYINHPYIAKNGISIINPDTNSTIVTKNADGSISVWLDTELDLANLEQSLYYDIKIRYKLNNFQSNEITSSTNEADLIKYKNCYVYYYNNGQNSKYYYEAQYRIVIDRMAPSNNIDNLNASDTLVEDYNIEFGTESMFENSYHQTNSYIYFTKQYAKYYETDPKDNQYIYAYRVYETTPFDTTDVSKIYVKEINDPTAPNAMDSLKKHNLILPLLTTTDYTVNDVSLAYYQGLNVNGFALSNNKYYEIIEEDAAGNVTQYVIHYNPSDPEINIPIQITTTNSENLNVDISFGIETTNYNIFEISTDEISSRANDNFYKIVLKRSGGEVIKTTLTKSTSDFGIIGRDIVESIGGFGNYELVLTARGFEKTITINHYDQNNLVAINIENLVRVNNNNYTIVLTNAKKQNEDKTIWYFAEEIVVTTSSESVSYFGEMVNGEVKYYYYPEGNKRYRSEIPCLEDTTYVLTMTVLGNTTSHRFNTSGKEFTELNFDEENGYFESDLGGEITYYTFTSAELKFDKTVYYSIVYEKQKGEFVLSSIEADLSDTYGKISLDAFFDATTGEGALLEYKIELYLQSDKSIEKEYYIIIDTRLSSVALRDYATGKQKGEIRYFNNADYTQINANISQPAFGINSLKWTEVEENLYFDYEYNLHELLKDETYRTIQLTGQSSTVIATADDGSGIYKFEITVYTKDGKYAGNRVYLFEVQPASNQIYFVRDEAGKSVIANSQFKVAELSDPLMKSSILSTYTTINEKFDLPLYITNQNLTIGKIDEDVTIDYKEFDQGNYAFRIYQVVKVDVFEIYFGVLKFDLSENLITNFSITPAIGQVDFENETSYTITGTDETVVKILASYAIQTDYLYSKNEILLEVKYMNELVSCNEFTGEYEIRGNGNYTFAFKDMAGNVHKFANGDQERNVSVLREVVVTLNNQVPFDNAYYNGEVALIVQESFKYVTASVRVEAKRNGNPYQPTGFNPYYFTESGTYRVIITAEYNGTTGIVPLSKVVTFTIINVKEARKSIDLTGLGGCEITSVSNQFGDNVTEKFIAMMKSNGRMNISYEDIMEHSEDLNVTSGKQTFTINYVVNDGKYPPRDVKLAFTLNNEEVTISCSLEKGETTTKGFTIYFNAAVIYEKIGESYIYINNRLVAHIDENSANARQKISTTYDDHGDGDYYVKLVSTSDVILDCYKVTIKEPLNASAIIIIVVVAVVVIVVVVTVIVLRRKMRIR